MVSSRTASAPPQKKCKKKGLPHYFNATAPSLIWSAFGKSEEIDDETLKNAVESAGYKAVSVKTREVKK